MELISKHIPINSLFTHKQLTEQLPIDPHLISGCLKALHQEGYIEKHDKTKHLLGIWKNVRVYERRKTI